MKQKIFLSNFSFQKQKQLQLELCINQVNVLREEQHILGDLNINLYQNGSVLGERNKNIIKGRNKVSSETKNIQNFVKLLALKKT